MGIERVKGAQVGDGHQDDGHRFVNHHGGGGIGQAAVAGGEVPHAAQQGACGAAHQHQCLGEERVNIVVKWEGDERIWKECQMVQGCSGVKTSLER